MEHRTRVTKMQKLPALKLTEAPAAKHVPINAQRYQALVSHIKRLGEQTVITHDSTEQSRNKTNNKLLKSNNTKVVNEIPDSSIERRSVPDNPRNKFEYLEEISFKHKNHSTTKNKNFKINVDIITKNIVDVTDDPIHTESAANKDIVCEKPYVLPLKSIMKTNGKFSVFKQYESITEEFLKPMVDNNIYNIKRVRWDHTGYKTKGLKEYKPNDGNRDLRKYQKLVGKFRKVCNAINFCFYLIKNIRVVKDNRKSLSYSFYANYYNRVYKTTFDYLFSATYFICSRFCANTKKLKSSNRCFTNDDIMQDISMYTVKLISRQ